MCGIVGYIGERQALPVLIEGLERLEYRGYDSAGLACVVGGRVLSLKKRGKLNVLRTLLQARYAHKFRDASVGIAHTRWATHGEPNDVNAHPHTNSDGTLAVVHNGIIENYEELKRELIRAGYRFRSDTDTEVLPHLIDRELRRGKDLFAAVRAVVRRLEGAYALCIVSSTEPDRLIVTRRGSPLVIGLAKSGNYVASDVPAFLKHTNRAIFLPDDQIAVLRRDRVTVFARRGKPVTPAVHTISWNVEQAEKGGYPNFMLKEIHEQPKAITATLLGRISPGRDRVRFDAGVERVLNRSFIRQLKGIVIVSCGTAYHAGLIGEYLIERYANIHVSVDLASEFRYRDPEIDERTLVIVVSQSGETADTLAALRLARKKGACALAICNVVGSTIAREADAVIYTQAGPEIAVASTKAYTSQITTFCLLTVFLGRMTAHLSRAAARSFLVDLERVADKVETLLEQKQLHRGVKRIARQYCRTKYFLYVGRNINYPTALEGALKLKEICYISSEGYAAGEMKHGPIALAYDKLPVFVIAPESDIYDKMFSNIREIKARRADILAVATAGDRRIGSVAKVVVQVPRTIEFLSPLITIVPLQLVAYAISCTLGYDPDKPRNLAKSVTVE